MGGNASEQRRDGASKGSGSVVSRGCCACMAHHNARTISRSEPSWEGRDCPSQPPNCDGKRMGTYLDYLSSVAGILQSVFFDASFPLTQCHVLATLPCFSYILWLPVVWQKSGGNGSSVTGREVVFVVGVSPVPKTHLQETD